ncbi:FecCD family ABC transporter permease [Rhodococcus sp. NPDC058521]|uniref:FecCD family ABC transporter permease n=1 Tax=Rhodococcus sp. NPDC058521 TaxID=3346536 RepID=UPI00364CEDCD
MHSPPASTAAPDSVRTPVGRSDESALPRRDTDASARRWVERPLAIQGLCLLLGLTLLVSAVLACAIGGTSIPVGDTLRYLGAAVFGDSIERQEVSAYQIVWNIRAPRVLLAALVGAGLGAAGAVIQAMVRNVLADPFLLGVSSGASVGAVSVTIVRGGFASLSLGSLASGLGASLTVLGAFVGALVATTLVWVTARRRDDGVSPVRLVLTGVVLAAGFQAVMSVLIYLVPDTESTATILFWSMGSFGAARWELLLPVAVLVVVSVMYFVRRASALDVLSLGDEAAAGLGVQADRTRSIFFVVVSLATAAVTAVCGAIGFVGLVVPHAVRMIVGASHRRVLLVSPFVGALFMVWADVLARTLVAPRELPISAITALIGVPVFIVLLRRRGRVLGAR